MINILYFKITDQITRIFNKISNFVKIHTKKLGIN